VIKKLKIVPNGIFDRKFKTFHYFAQRFGIGEDRRWYNVSTTFGFERVKRAAYALLGDVIKSRM